MALRLIAQLDELVKVVIDADQFRGAFLQVFHLQVVDCGEGFHELQATGAPAGFFGPFERSAEENYPECASYQGDICGVGTVLARERVGADQPAETVCYEYYWTGWRLVVSLSILSLPHAQWACSYSQSRF